jgi:hypothetical protein
LSFAGEPEGRAADSRRGTPLIARTLGAAFLACGVFLAPFPSAAQADLALVMAVDVSSSIDDQRFTLQREGLAAGLESVLGAVGPGRRQTLELAIVEWSEEQNVLVDWTIIRTRADLDVVVHALRTAVRPTVGWKTNVGGGIAKAIALFESAPLAADRKVIDVSGDGQQNDGNLPAQRARDEAVANEITINGLPITSGDEPDVDRWYQDHVIGGNGAFIVVANGHDDFSNAMRRKLALEVAGLTPTVAIAVTHPPRRIVD